MTPVRNSVESESPPIDVAPLLRRLCDRAADVVFFPVRHHSPLGATLVAQLIQEMKPSSVLIEGPSDFNAHLPELMLDHELPIAIYSYFQTSEGKSSGAYYPFCEYSPEWSALRTASLSGIPVRFVDLPWSETAAGDAATHRYADLEMRRGRYVRMLCQRMEVEDFDDLWDRMLESHDQLTLDDYFERVHSLCTHIRVWEEHVSASDRRREAFMAEAIRQARTEGRVLVVTGGFHSSALAARLDGLLCPGVDDPDVAPQEPPPVLGIALTSYSYERLDNLIGYNAGMPSPGFYEHTWRQRQAGETFTHQPLLVELVAELRKRKQILSTADLIAVETSARALAALRGRDHVWRRDLIDAVTSALIKDELEYGCASPFVDAVHSILRGRRRGKLAAGTRLPPLVRDIHNQLADAGFEIKKSVQDVELDLLEATDLAKSRLLHRLRILGIVGFERAGGTDFLERGDLTRLWETWRLRWSPEFDSSCIEASRYGVTLAEAAASRLQESARNNPRNASTASSLLVQAAQAGIDTLSASLQADLQDLIQNESEFAPAAETLGHLLFLFCFDEAFGTRSHRDLGPLLKLAFERSLWLLELIGRTLANMRDVLDGMRGLLDAFQRTADVLETGAAEFSAVMARVEQDRQKPPAVRGAAAGILWTLGAADSARIVGDLLLFADPNDLGDFLAGLFASAREVAQRHPPLVQAVDRLLLEFSSDNFQQALPSLRLAFTYFTPREKHHMLTTLFTSLGVQKPEPLTAVDAITAAEALALDERVFEAMATHGLDGDVS